MINYRTSTLICLAALLLSPMVTAQTKSINLTLAESENLVLGDLDAALTNEHLVFERLIDGNKSVWSYHTRSKELTALNLENASAITTFKNLAVISIKGSDDTDSVFISDGTPEGTTSLVNGSNLILEVTQHAIYIFNDNDSWSTNAYRYDGQQMTRDILRGSVALNPAHNQNICEPNSEQFSVLLEVRSVQPGYVGTEQHGNYEINNNRLGDLRSQETKVDNLLGQCFISGRDNNSGTSFDLKFIHNNGNNETYEFEELGPKLSGFTELNEQLYAVETINREQTFKIHQLNPDTLESMAAVQVALPDGLRIDIFYPPILLRAGDALLSSYYGDLQLFDVDLKPLELNQSGLTQLFYVTQETEVSGNDHFTLLANRFYQPTFYGYTKQNPDILFLSNQQVIARFKSSTNFRLDRLHNNPTGQVVSLSAFDYTTQKQGYYQIDDKPKINKLVNGLWYNNELSNQGFSISKGIRQDRSEYVFLTAYLFREGQPLWLAGNTNLNGSPDTLTIDLYEYDGPQLFEPNQSANRSLFGQVELELMSCNTLQASIDADDQIHQLLLNRADNTFYTDWCQE